MFSTSKRGFLHILRINRLAFNKGQHAIRQVSAVPPSSRMNEPWVPPSNSLGSTKRLRQSKRSNTTLHQGQHGMEKRLHTQQGIAHCQQRCNRGRHDQELDMTTKCRQQREGTSTGREESQRAATIDAASNTINAIMDRNCRRGLADFSSGLRTSESREQTTEHRGAHVQDRYVITQKPARTK